MGFWHVLLSYCSLVFCFVFVFMLSLVYSFVNTPLILSCPVDHASCVLDYKPLLYKGVDGITFITVESILL